MTETLHHRGPDSSGQWLDPTAGIALGHCRLSIVDLSPQGHQPMISSDGRFVVVYNGEVYNHGEIRSRLEKEQGSICWRGYSDTEVILEAIRCYGLEHAVTLFTGMFAIALWDRREKTLCLVRDRLGEKPLYFGWQGDHFLFGSELKALRKHQSWQGEIDRDALALYLRFSGVPAPYSIYKNIHKLQPGAILRLTHPYTQESLQIQAYWSLEEVVRAGLQNSFTGSVTEAEEQLESLLRKAIGQQMVADVPLGAFLSGGVDSSTVVALMQAMSPRPVKTFTIGFHEDSYNEATFAREVARHLGTDHTEHYLSSEDAMAVIPRIPELYDEVFADCSQIPTYLVSEVARREVTVSLSGDGGDEIFSGYNRYLWASNLSKWTGAFPHWLRGMAAGLLQAVSPTAWDGLFRLVKPLLPNSIHFTMPGDRIHKLAHLIGARSVNDLYLDMVSNWLSPETIVKNVTEPSTPLTEAQKNPPTNDSIAAMMFYDTISYLPDDILVKVDRASMAVSLESRIPFLDHRIVEFAWRLPLFMKLHHGKGKRLLRNILYKYVPPALIERPKTGFGVPIDSWLRGPLRDWAEDLLSVQRIQGDGFFHPSPIRKTWEEHLSGKRNWQYRLWHILMFQSWYDRWEKGN
jgi:asparagine synthase (glutamine-hydrolysing)